MHTRALPPKGQGTPSPQWIGWVGLGSILNRPIPLVGKLVGACPSTSLGMGPRIYEGFNLNYGRSVLAKRSEDGLVADE